MEFGSEGGQDWGPGAEAGGGDGASVDVDALLTEIEAGGSAAPQMTGGTATGQQPASPNAAAAGQAPTTQPQPGQNASQPPVAEIEFEWNGKQIKVPTTDPRARQWLGQGYDYAQRMQAFKAEQEAFNRAKAELDPVRQRYSELEAYVEKNPEWWEHVNSQYQQAQAAGQGLDPSHPVAKELAALKAQIGDVLKFKNDSEARRLSVQREQQDQVLNDEIQSIRTQFKDLDWNTVSPDGQSMELQVLKFMQDNHIGLKADGTLVPGAFKQAFLLYNHDRFLKRAEEKAKEDVIKERQKATKLGLLGQSSAPKRGITQAEDIKQKSWDELMREGAEEFGVAL